MKKYELVSQEDKWGCGTACVASLLGVSYQEARELVEKVKGRSINSKPYGLQLDDIALALKEKKIKVIADWDPTEMPNGTIACITGEHPYDRDHYLLRTPHGWMDPWYDLEKNNMVAEYRERYPDDTDFLVALIPVSTKKLTV